MEKASLNENHKRRLAVAMAMVDAAASRILDLLDETTSPKARAVIEQSLFPEERVRLQEAMRRLRPLTAAFTRRYDLERRSKSLRRMAVTELSQIWTTLENCRPRRMRGMGEVPHAVAQPLEQDVERMLQVFDEIRRALGT
jgi:hypothetical protein